MRAPQLALLIADFPLVFAQRGRSVLRVPSLTGSAGQPPPCPPAGRRPPPRAHAQRESPCPVPQAAGPRRPCSVAGRRPRGSSAPRPPPRLRCCCSAKEGSMPRRQSKSAPLADWPCTPRWVIQAAERECPPGHARALRELTALALHKVPSRGIFDPGVRGEEDLFAAIESVA